VDARVVHGHRHHGQLELKERRNQLERGVARGIHVLRARLAQIAGIGDHADALQSGLHVAAYRLGLGIDAQHRHLCSRARRRQDDRERDCAGQLDRDGAGHGA
jgi:hypothetical protein